jgi:hypothetical protein
MTIWDEARESGPKRRRRPAANLIPAPIAPKAEKPSANPTGPTADHAGPRLSGSQHRSQIELTAYYLAEQRGFAAGHELEDWLTAEILVINRSGIPVVS